MKRKKSFMYNAYRDLYQNTAKQLSKWHYESSEITFMNKKSSETLFTQGRFFPMKYFFKDYFFIKEIYFDA